MKQIPLTNSSLFVLVDDCWFETFSKSKWRLNNDGYVVNQQEGGYFYMHRFVKGDKTGFEIDHINGVKYDNREVNFRWATKTDQRANCKLYKNNKSGMKGVYWCPYGRNWRVEIRKNNVRISLGRFDSLEEAGRRYDQAATKYFGEFARLNFPSS